MRILLLSVSLAATQSDTEAANDTNTKKEECAGRIFDPTTTGEYYYSSSILNYIIGSVDVIASIIMIGLGWFVVSLTRFKNKRITLLIVGLVLTILADTVLRFLLAYEIHDRIENK